MWFRREKGYKGSSGLVGQRGRGDQRGKPETTWGLGGSRSPRSSLSEVFLSNGHQFQSLLLLSNPQH